MNAREFAIEVVKQLQAAGFETLWAGGCVRDRLLSLKPKDFDVATSATPDEVQEVFGHKKTLSIGKSFGVITVLGPSSTLNVEVATFRRDGDYSDGRRPDSVEFTDAREDALRRDFTINGMFYDPVNDLVIDYVNGQQDLKKHLIRAIGNPEERIEEDRLRMLRGVRFAATYGFDLESETMAAIQRHASDIVAVSAERIGAEIRRMLSHKNCALAFELLIDSGLWANVLPNSNSAFDWKQQIPALERLDADFATALAVVLHGSGISAESLQESWRLKNDEVTRAEWILTNASLLGSARELAWSQLQPLLTSAHAPSAVQFLRASDEFAAESAEGIQSSVAICEEKLALERDVLDPPPLVRGGDLFDLGVSPGPEFKMILAEVRKMQLDGLLGSGEEAKQWIRESGR